MSPDYTSSLRHFRRKVAFTSTDMRMEYITNGYKWRPSGRTFSYKCMKMVANDTFIVAVHDKNTPIQYTCIKFIFRSNNVVQLKFGGLMYDKTDELCREDKLHLMDAPLVYFYDRETFWTEPRNQNMPYKACPLEGGYVLSEWYEGQKSMCRLSPEAPVSVKLENECERGDGLAIMGGSSVCPPVYSGSPLYCLGDWSDGEFTYMVLFRELIDFDILCMRYPTNHKGQFTAYLFMDGVCDSTKNITSSRRYRRMVLDHHIDPTTDPCSNDSPVCNEFIPPSDGCDRTWTTFCRDTCHTCPWRRPWRNVTIPEPFRGVYYKDTIYQGAETVTINENFLDIPSLGKYELFGRSTCSSVKHSHGLGDNFEEFVFIQAFDNGCSPRLVIAQLATRTPSVNSIRLGTSVTVDWKLFDKLSKSPNPDYGSLACPTSKTFRKPPINIRETFRTLPHGWFNLIRMKYNALPTTSCVLPNFKHIKMTFDSGVTCTGTSEGTSDRSFQFSFKDCKDKSNKTSLLKKEDIVEFECLSTFKAITGRKKQAQLTTFVITKAFNSANSILNESMHCWMYSELHQDKIYLSRVSDCDGNVWVYFFEYGGMVKRFTATVAEMFMLTSQATNLQGLSSTFLFVLVRIVIYLNVIYHELSIF